MESVETTSFAVRAWRGFRRCFWQSTEERLTAPEWWVVVSGVVGRGFELGIGVLAFVTDRLVRVCQSAIQLELGRG